MRHTPGPLTVHPLDREERIKAGTEILATVHHLGQGREAEQHANAQLYAAAPVMLAALEQLANMKTVEEYGEDAPEVDDWASTLSDMIIEARTIITQAKGAHQ